MMHIGRKGDPAIKVFLADDHPLVRSGIKQAFHEYVDIAIVGEAGDGQEAIHGILNNDVDVSLMDIRMPKHDGIQVMSKVLQKKPKSKFIFITGHDESHYALRLMKLGAKGYIHKTEPSEKLAQAIRNVHWGDMYFSGNVISMLMQMKANQDEATSYENLSAREFEVFRMIGNKKTSSEVADALNISRKTVSAHIANIGKKLNLKNHTEIIHHAARSSLFN